MSPKPDLTQLVALGGGRHRTATQHVEAALRDAILSGRLPGGTALRQEDLAQAFGVSRMPVREALRQLEAQALLDFVPHKGAVVTEISAADAADLYAIRMALEPACFARSIPYLEDSDLAEAQELIDEMDRNQDPGQMGMLNRRFHMGLYRRAGQAKLLALTEASLASFDRYLRFHLAAHGPAHMSQDDHRAMLEAARRRETDQALSILQHHLSTAAAMIAAFFAARAENENTPENKRGF